MTGPQPLVAPPREQRASVPRGWLGVLYGTWPLLALACLQVNVSGLRSAAEYGGLWLCLALAVARALYWIVLRRRNRVDVVGASIRLVDRGNVVEFDASEIRALYWHYGFWNTYSPTTDWTTFGVTLADGREFYVELVLPRWREQRKAFQRLADALPPMDWTIRWPYSVIPKRDRMWNRAQGRVPR